MSEAKLDGVICDNCKKVITVTINVMPNYSILCNDCANRLWVIDSESGEATEKENGSV